MTSSLSGADVSLLLAKCELHVAFEMQKITFLRTAAVVVMYYF